MAHMGPHVEWGWESPEPQVIPRKDSKRSISLDIKFCHLFDLFKERNGEHTSRRLFPPSSGIFRVCSLIYSLSEEQQSHLLISLYPLSLSFYAYPISLRGSINFRYSFFWSVSLFYYFMRSGFWLESLFMLVSGGFQVDFFFFCRLQFVWFFFFYNFFLLGFHQFLIFGDSEENWENPSFSLFLMVYLLTIRPFWLWNSLFLIEDFS